MKNEIRTLADRFMEGMTTLDEERRLESLLLSEPLPDDLLPLREMMADLTAIRLPKAQHKSLRWRRWTMAAAITTLLVSGATLWWNHRKANECVAYIYGKRCTDREVVIREMHQSMSIIAQQPANEVDHMLNDMFDI